MALDANIIWNIVIGTNQSKKGTHMKTLLLSFLVAFARAADTPTVGGKWQVHTSISGNESDQDCTFTQKDHALSGSCASDRGTFQISGSINGNKVTWSYKSEHNGTPLTVQYEGALDSATRIRGNVNVPEFGAAGDFTATQSK
jgi:hypothetical protein